MLFDLFSRPAKEQRRAHTGPRPGVTSFRPQLEAIEDRTVPAHLLPADLVTITDVNLGDLSIVDGVLTAAEGTVEGTLAGLPFTTDIANFALQLLPDDPETEPVECSVLDLSLAPIDIDLLGLHVDTSAICLEITATEGGGLLGDLLCGIAGGLPTLPDLPVLGDLSGELGGLLDDVLTTVLSTGGDPPAGAEDICDGEFEILDLALGPVDLSLLGLNVGLDNCDGGPVQVCVSASQGEGLLGDLLSGLAGRGRGLDLDLNDITQIGTQAADAFEDGILSGRERGQLTSLVNRLK
jgi:hypothetical protein